MKKFGIDLSRDEKFILQNQMKLICEKKKAYSLSFFGIIKAVSQDYYILIGKSLTLNKHGLNAQDILVS